jgi:RimJ/RimL family protein N-acetyltransferase
VTVTLETDRLILRPPILADLDPLAALMETPETRFIGGPLSRPETWRTLMGWAGAWSLQGFSMFSVLEKSTGRWVGRVGPHFPEGWPGPEVGWSVVKDVNGKGYATEAATAAIDWAFDRLGWEEVIHCIAEDNLPSQGVARKLGARILREGMLPPPINVMTACWGQSRDQWRARRQ